MISTQPLELIHSDVWGQAPTTSITGFKYYIPFIDHFLKYNWLSPMFNKLDICDVFARFNLQIENLLSLKIKKFRSDVGEEYFSAKFKSPHCQWY